MSSRRILMLTFAGLAMLGWCLLVAVSPNAAADKAKKTDAEAKDKAGSAEKPDAADGKKDKKTEEDEDASKKKVVKTDAEWKKQLTPMQFRVTRKKGTERPGTGIYAHTKKDGIYRCICCGQPLFDSKTKFESGTGWPSFYQPLNDKAVNYIEDTSADEVRTEVECSRCDAHLGHVFADGPQPTGRRYCMNSASLNLVTRDAVDKDAKGKDAKAKSGSADKGAKAKEGQGQDDEKVEKK